MNHNIQQLTFSRDSYSKVLDVANELADLEDRSPHNSICRIILTNGRAQINKLRAEIPSSLEGTEHNT